MQMIWQAIRAVTVEVMGVGAVIFVLFNTAGWTFESVGASPHESMESAARWFESTKDRVAEALRPEASAEQRHEFAADRLDFYGRFYRDAAGNFVDRAVREPSRSDSAAQPNRLLGAL